MNINLFIDTNVYLGFYHFSNEDLEELRKLLVAMRNRDIKLFVTEQVKQEFTRNREAKIADALKQFAEQKLPNQFPQLFKNYIQYEEMRNSLHIFEEHKSKIIETLTKDIEEKTLTADQIISELFASATVIAVTADVLEKAKLRLDLGNPPGKNGSYGDAINWETLLSEIPTFEDLYLVSDDRDYSSDIDKSKPRQFLKEEWEKEHGKIFFYQRLSDFFSDKFPNIKLASELYKELLINDLTNSPNFSFTHGVLRKLSKYIADFAEPQVNQITDALIENRQVYWISQDGDVQDFVRTLIKEKGNMIVTEKLEKIQSIYNNNGEVTAAEQS